MINSNKDIFNEIHNGENDFISNVMKNVNKLRENVLITCFSKRNDSILMWSHYASSHTGVCFEIENDNHLFEGVRYSNRKISFDIYSITQKILALDFLNEKDDYNDKFLNKRILSTFFTKSLDWKYENEVRFVTMDKNNKKINFNDDGKYTLKVKIKKIYIGSKVSNDNNLNELLLLAKNRNIQVVFMKEDKNKFKISPDYSKNMIPVESAELKFNSLEQLKYEINKCLDNDCFIAALSLSLSVPSLLGKICYPNLNEKEAYIKWFQENIGKYEHSPKYIKHTPYLSGDLCYSLKCAIQNNCDTNVCGNYEDFILDNFCLRIEKKDFWEIYSWIAYPRYGGMKNSLLEVNVRDICRKIVSFIDFFNESNKYSIPYFSIRRVDKEKEKMHEKEIRNQNKNI